MKIPSSVLAELRAIAGEGNIVTSPEGRLVYECDAFTLAKGTADLVVMVDRREQVAPIVRVLSRARIPFIPRGSGTGLSGGVCPKRGGVVVSLARLKGILQLNPREGYAVVEPGVINAHLSRAAEPYGYCFAPDPGSQCACTIGGNAGFNAGGPHTLKVGVTTNHVLGLEIVLPDGEVAMVGGPAEDAPGLDLRGLMVGAEGTFGIVTRIWVRLTRMPRAWKTLLAVFPAFEDSTRAVSSIIAAGIIPAALELMDRLVIAAVEQSFGVGLPQDAGAVLVIELDGDPEGLGRQAVRVDELCREKGASDVRASGSEEERAALWAGRKKAGAAIGVLAAGYCTQDVVIPRARLPEMAVAIGEIASRHGVRIANLLHAGDGNLHPLILLDERKPDEVTRAIAASHEIVEKTIELGGSITGEHGIGIEKTGFMEKQFGPDEVEIMRRVKAAIDPANLSNPGKALPEEPAVK